MTIYDDAGIWESARPIEGGNIRLSNTVTPVPNLKL
jgi:hypothetical protein